MWQGVQSTGPTESSPVLWKYSLVYQSVHVASAFFGFLCIFKIRTLFRVAQTKGYEKWDWERTVLVLLGLALLLEGVVIILGTVSSLSVRDKSVQHFVYFLQFLRASAISLRMTSILVVMMQMFESIHMITGESFAARRSVMLLSIVVTVCLVMSRPFAVSLTYLSHTLCHHWIDVVCAIVPLLLTGLTLFWLRADCVLLEESQKDDFLSLLGQSPHGPASNQLLDQTTEPRSSVLRRNLLKRANLQNNRESLLSRPSQRSTLSKKTTNMLVINLEFLWERVSRFQLFLFSVFFGDLMWLVRLIFLMISAKSYSDYGTCELIYAVAINKTRSLKMGGSWKWAFLSAGGDGLFYALVTVFPTIFVLDIIQATLFKKGASATTQDDQDRNSGFFQSAERVDSKLMKLEDSFEENYVPSGPQLQDSDGNFAAPKVKKKLVSEMNQEGKMRRQEDQKILFDNQSPNAEDLDYYRPTID